VLSRAQVEAVKLNPEQHPCILGILVKLKPAHFFGRSFGTSSSDAVAAMSTTDHAFDARAFDVIDSRQNSAFKKVLSSLENTASNLHGRTMEEVVETNATGFINGGFSVAVAPLFVPGDCTPNPFEISQPEHI